MKIFVSWSGDRSRRVAEVVCNWLPVVIQSVDPYMSSEDIDKGARWSAEISTELEQSEFGIVCVTPENISAPWLNFEAGALSNSYGKLKVAPLLIGTSPTELTGPMVQFQATKFEKLDVKKLINSINNACGDAQLEPQILDQVFETWWPKLDKELTPIRDEEEVETEPQRSTSDLLTEILETVRSQQRVLNSPTEILPPDYLRFALEEIDFRGDHQVFDDLDDCWRGVRKGMAAFDEDGGQLLHIATRDADPMVRYILDRFVSRGKHRRRRLPRLKPVVDVAALTTEPPGD